MRFFPFLLLLSFLPSVGLAAQGDSTRVDSVSASRLPEVVVTIPRHRTVSSNVPGAVTVLDRAEMTRGRRTIGLDEALSGVAGLLVSNRENFSLDQRLSIRGFGSRANFGMRGVRLLVDGVPQTLPDGQSQLTNLDLAAIDRVEILHGASSALYGNAAGGVVQFTSRTPTVEGTTSLLRFQAGSHGMTRAHSWTGVKRGNTTASLAMSRTDLDGFRDHSAARFVQGAGRVDQRVGLWSFGFRAAVADAPKAQNPGALTEIEANQTPTMAAPNNVARGADKDVTQTQLSFHAQRDWIGGLTAEAVVFGIWRDLDNPLATPPPAAGSPTEGTFNQIDRWVVGSRLEVTLPLAHRRGRITAGADWQRMRDRRTNLRSIQGRPTAEFLVNQREVVTEFGPFVEAAWVFGSVGLQGGVRYDRLAFTVDDRLRTGDANRSGRRVMSNLSGSIGTTLHLGRSLSTYLSLGTAFESPTSTELVSQPDGTIGLNANLGPQRSTSMEWGLRGALNGASFRFAAYRTLVHDAIVQAREQDGRAVFQNAGQTRHQGMEVDVRVPLGDNANLRGAYTLSDLTFRQYRVPNRASVDTLDGNRLPGVPIHRLRLGLQTRGHGFTLDVDHTISSSVLANDANTLRASSWGAGVTDLRITWITQRSRALGSPFVGIENLFDRRYIGSVTVNGFGGRVFEPAAGRELYIGFSFSLGWPSPALP